MAGIHGGTRGRAGPPPLDLHHHLPSLFKEHLSDRLLHRVTFQVEVSPFHFSSCLIFRQTRSRLPGIHQEICLLLALYTNYLSSVTDRKKHLPLDQQHHWLSPGEPATAAGRRGVTQAGHFCKGSIGGNVTLGQWAFFIITMTLAL